jgi:hypothetical protein
MEPRRRFLLVGERLYIDVTPDPTHGPNDTLICRMLTPEERSLHDEMKSHGDTDSSIYERIKAIWQEAKASCIREWDEIERQQLLRRATSILRAAIPSLDTLSKQELRQFLDQLTTWDPEGPEIA